MLSSRRSTQPQEEEALKAAFYQQIGQVKVERDWLKNKWAMCVAQQRARSEPAHPQLSIRRQCGLLG